jgi:hypothetical protein
MIFPRRALNMVSLGFHLGIAGAFALRVGKKRAVPALRRQCCWKQPMKRRWRFVHWMI